MRVFIQQIVASLLALFLSSVGWAAELVWSKDMFSSLDGGTGSRFGSSKMSLSVPLERQKTQRERFYSDFHLDMTQFRWSGTSAAQADYIWLSMPIEYRQVRGNGMELHVKAEPGLMTDLDALGTENIGVNVEISGRSYVGPSAFWQYGLIVDRQFGDLNPRPLLAYATRLTDSTEMLLGFPRTNIQTRWNRVFSTYFKIYPDGGFWREEVDVPTTAATDTTTDTSTVSGSVDVSDVSYRNWRMGLGGEFLWRDNLWITAEIGQLRNRSIRADDITSTSVKGEPGENGYWRLGANLRF